MTPPPPPAATAAPPAPTQGRGRASITRPRASLWADRAFAAITFLACVIGVAVVIYLIVKTVEQTGDVWSTFGVWGFITGTEWIPTPVSGPPQFGALPFIYGTLMTALIAMVLAVPAADRRGAGHDRPPSAPPPRPGRRRRSTCWPRCRRSSTASGASPCSCRS